MTILVVDDCPEACTVIGEFLAEGMPEAAVEYAYSGDEALHRIAELKPSLVVLNIVMPGKTGFDVLEQLRADGNNVPVVLTSGTASAKVLARGTLNDERVRFLDKPFSWTTLVATVKALLHICAAARPPAARPRGTGRGWTER